MPDGLSILYTSEREGQPNVYRQRVDATWPPERITSGPDMQAPMSVSPDGTTAIVRESSRTKLETATGALGRTPQVSEAEDWPVTAGTPLLGCYVPGHRVEDYRLYGRGQADSRRQ
jgi:Tol biopolymer transport system component